MSNTMKDSSFFKALIAEKRAHLQSLNEKEEEVIIQLSSDTTYNRIQLLYVPQTTNAEGEIISKDHIDFILISNYAENKTISLSIEDSQALVDALLLYLPEEDDETK